MANPNPLSQFPSSGDDVAVLLRKLLFVVLGLIRGDDGVSLVVRNGASASTTAATLAEGTKAVAASGTPERLVAVATLVESVTITALAGNTNPVYVGFSAGDGTQTIPLPYTLVAPAGKKIDLNAIFVDVTTNGEGVRYSSAN